MSPLKLLVLGALFALAAAPSHASPMYSWRYYRLGNTGIQGDNNDALWVGPDGNPYIAGYDASFEEGGFAKFVQNENRWENFSNVDYPVIGHPEEQGCVRLTDIAADASGKLWMGTWLGALRFDPALGGSSLTRFGPGNSPLSGSTVLDVETAPDGTVWFADNGCVRYNPATNTWTQWDAGSARLAAQPKPGGGYYVWSADTYFGSVFRFDSATQSWSTLSFPTAPGDVAGLPGRDCVDDAGNLWALRMTSNGDWETLDYRTPSGTWVTPAPPYASVTFGIEAFRAYGNGRALLVDGGGVAYQFNGISWVSLGTWRPGPSTTGVDIDAAGNVWVCGRGGAARRDAQTGQWQRYRITNTSNFDNFNRDIAIDPVQDVVYTGANAGPGIGGMVSFDGERWTCWDQLTYGLGHDWPFATDFCRALAYEPSSGKLAVSPAEWIYGIHEWDGTGFQQMPGLDGAVGMCEDSQSRLWALGEYFNLHYETATGWNMVPIIGWGAMIQKDPSRPGTVWTSTESQLLRTDGSYTFERTPDQFPGTAGGFTGMAAAPGGIVWAGLWTQFTPTGSSLIRLDANTGDYTMFSHDAGWPFPGEHVHPLMVTPDGRVWMIYDSEFPSPENGLCWYDGSNVVSFQAPAGGEPQWGGLPHSAIADVEVRMIPDGYELWMSCLSRGIAVLSVHNPSVGVPPASGAAQRLSLSQNEPNPFHSATRIRFNLGRPEHVALDVFDVSGRRVRSLADRTLDAGSHQIEWDGRDDRQQTLSSGVYFCRLRAGSESVQRRMVLIP